MYVQNNLGTEIFNNNCKYGNLLIFDLIKIFIESSLYFL